MPERPQSLENHGRYVVGYHVVTFAILLVILFWRLYTLITRFSGEMIVQFLVVVALVLVAFYARAFALTAQDRVIRLEMRLRLAQLLSPDLAAQIDRFTVGQLVALRFAGDAELPELARKVLADNVTDRKAIKRLVKDWQGDYLRV
jgi:hypothetical protein